MSAIKNIRVMPYCNDCKFYKEVDGSKGDCFGCIVACDADADECPSDSFHPRERSKED